MFCLEFPISSTLSLTTINLKNSVTGFLNTGLHWMNKVALMTKWNGL